MDIAEIKVKKHETEKAIGALLMAFMKETDVGVRAVNVDYDIVRLVTGERHVSLNFVELDLRV